jgi:hypothetical protein
MSFMSSIHLDRVENAAWWVVAAQGSIHWRPWLQVLLGAKHLGHWFIFQKHHLGILHPTGT